MVRYHSILPGKAEYRHMPVPSGYRQSSENEHFCPRRHAAFHVVLVEVGGIGGVLQKIDSVVVGTADAENEAPDAGSVEARAGRGKQAWQPTNG